MLIDTHAHLNFPQLLGQIDDVLERAQTAGVEKIICVGTNPSDSAHAVTLAETYPQCFAVVGLHPHDAKNSAGAITRVRALLNKPKVVGIGECGLDYHYNHSPKLEQQKVLRSQIELALEHKLPLVFHVREAFADFFKIIDNYPSLKGVVHSFSSSVAELDGVLSRGFYVGLNGIMTFTKEGGQLEAAKAVPADRLLLETDAPFLTPTPNRGKVNEPAYVKNIGEFLAKLRDEEFSYLAKVTSANTIKLFGL